MEEEVWKDIPGFEGYYQVSDLGRVRSLDRTIVRSDGLAERQTGRIKITKPGHYGYPLIRLNANGKGRTFTVHYLVMLTFVGPRERGMQINHKDGKRDNNNIHNLEYVTPAENCRHAARVLGTVSPPHYPQKGSQNNAAKLNDDQVRAIRRLYANNNISYSKLAIQFGVTISCIAFIINRKRWNHI